MRKLPLAISAAVIFFGCAAQHRVVREFTLSSDEVIKKVEERNNSIKTLKGSGAITVESPEASNSGSFEVFLKKPDSMRVEFRGPFGIHVGTLSLSREQFLFYNRRENVAVSGKADGTTLQAMFRLKLQFDEIVNAFAGEFPMNAAHDKLMKFYTSEDSYVLVFRNDATTKEFHIDGNDFVVTGYRILDEHGNASLVASTSDIAETKNVSMPNLLRIVFPNERRSITIAYDDIRINEPVVCSFSLPKTAELITR